MRLRLVPFCLILLSLSGNALAQQGILAPSRLIDWTKAGVAGGIPDRTTICATLNPGATAAQINTAIAACPAGQVVKLNAGTYSLSSGIVFNGKDNVTLRGAGPDATFLEFSGVDGCSGKQSMICVRDSVNQYPPEAKGTVANWTGGYAKGTTTITLDTKTNLQIGTTIVLDQWNDNGDADTGGIYVCTVQGSSSGGCVQSGGNSAPARDQQQFVTVTSIPSVACAPSCAIGISPAIYMPNWRAAKSPQAWWSSGIYVTGVGLEEFSIKYSTNPGGPFTIAFFNAQHSWIKNIRSIKPVNKHVLTFMSHHITVRDSYFFDTTNSVNDSYGTDSYFGGNHLVENNIFQRIAVPMMNESASHGNVFAYNYSINDLFDSNQTATSWMQASSYFHASGSSFVLWEGNDGAGVNMENYFGVVHFITGFRNRWHGWEPSGVESAQTVAVHNYARNRFNNFIGNVLGTNSYHTTYQSIGGSSDANCQVSIYAIGFGANCGNGGLSVWPPDDLNTLPTIMRWGNYDTVNDAVRFVASEVPSGSSFYPNPVPSGQSLPASFYLSARPAWWGTMPWPPIGPDVTGGDLPSVNGRAYRIPARKCFEDVMHGTFNDTTARTFNAKACYGTTSSPVPTAPANLRITGAAAFLMPLVFPILGLTRSGATGLKKRSPHNLSAGV